MLCYILLSKSTTFMWTINSQLSDPLYRIQRSQRFWILLFPSPSLTCFLLSHAPHIPLCLSVCQGIDEGPEGLKLISDIIREKMEIDVSVLMGANIANEVAAEKFCETTIGKKNIRVCTVKKKWHNRVFEWWNSLLCKFVPKCVVHWLCVLRCTTLHWFGRFLCKHYIDFTHLNSFGVICWSWLCACILVFKVFYVGCK